MQTSRAPHGSKARLRVVTNRRDSWRSHVHRTRFRRLSSSSSPRPAMSGVEGGRPSSFSGGFKGGILFEKRIPPLVPRRARRSPSRASAGKRMQRCRAAIESPAPYGRKKEQPLRAAKTPRALWARKKPRLRAAIKKEPLSRLLFQWHQPLYPKKLLKKSQGLE